MGDLILHLLYRCLRRAIRALGARGAAALGYLLGLALGALDGRRGRVTRHLRVAFGGPGSLAVRPRYYEHMGLLAVEFVRLGGFSPDSLAEWFEPEGIDRLREIVARGRGMIILTGHIGNWELFGLALVALGIPLHAYVRPVRIRAIDDDLERLRAGYGLRIHHKGDLVHGLLRAIRAGEAYGLMMDQDGSGHGVRVPFFSRMASTVPTAAKIAHRTGAALVPVTSFRLRSRTKHRLRVGPEVEVSATGDEERDVLVTTWRCNQALEQAIREHPAQWLWRHRRWQTRASPVDVRAWEEAAAHAAVATAADPAAAARRPGRRAGPPGARSRRGEAAEDPTAQRS